MLCNGIAFIETKKFSRGSSSICMDNYCRYIWTDVHLLLIPTLLLVECQTNCLLFMLHLTRVFAAGQLFYFHCISLFQQKTTKCSIANPGRGSKYVSTIISLNTPVGLPPTYLPFFLTQSSGKKIFFFMVFVRANE